MKLIDTAKLMVSTDYKERFKAEYHQLRIRHNNLEQMLVKYTSGLLDFQPTDIDLLNIQLSCMASYLKVLEVRAKKEDIKL